MATENDSPNTGALATIAAVGALALIGICLAVTALVRYEEDARSSLIGTAANVRPYKEMAAAQRSELAAAPTWVDKNTQKVSVPIERAMQLVVADISRDPENATAKASAGSATASAGGPSGAPATNPPPNVQPPPPAAPAPSGSAKNGQPKLPGPAPTSATTSNPTGNAP